VLLLQATQQVGCLARSLCGSGHFVMRVRHRRTRTGQDQRQNGGCGAGIRPRTSLGQARRFEVRMPGLARVPVGSHLPHPPRPAPRTCHRRRQPPSPHRRDRQPRPPVHALLARRLRCPAAHPGQPHHPGPATPAPGRPRRPRPGTHLDPDRRPPRHHRHHSRTPLPEQPMITLTTITRIMPMSGRAISRRRGRGRRGGRPGRGAPGHCPAAGK